MIIISKDKPSRIFGKVLKVENKGNYISLFLGTGEKQDDGIWKNSSWSCRLVGKAKDVLINKGDRVTINSCKIENVYDEKNKKNWLNVIVFDIENQDVKENKVVDSDLDEDLPF